ncbi:hypothetical protein BGZ76_008637 [Entomortierella beljakovae]|nr:hypothetical protein BGZ76_008637 [Entomortierella beljakovae]
MERLYTWHDPFEPIIDNPMSFSTMTIDYSKLITELQEFDVGRLDLFSLRRSSWKLHSPTLDNTTATWSDFEGNYSEDSSFEVDYYEDSSDEDSIFEVGYSEYNSDENSSRKTSEEDKAVINQKINNMLVHYNHGYITKLIVKANRIKELLPFATKFAKLETLYLRLDVDNVDSIISFINQNYSAFPKKMPIEVKLDEEWVIQPQATTFNFMSNMGHGGFISVMRQFRDIISQAVGPMTAILKAMKKPRRLNIRDIPNFYDFAENIDTDHLTWFQDNDQYRFQMGGKYGDGEVLSTLQ